MERVIRDPKHPYTRLLVASIPLPDLSTPWGGDEVQIPEAALVPGSGCLFAPRCPHATEVCWADAPPSSGPTASAGRVLPLSRHACTERTQYCHRISPVRAGPTDSIRRTDDVLKTEGQRDNKI